MQLYKGYNIHESADHFGMWVAEKPDNQSEANRTLHCSCYDARQWVDDRLAGETILENPMQGGLF